MDFRKYDDPKRAERIWRSYMADGSISANIRASAETFARECETAEDLDVGLDGITTGHSTLHLCSGPSSPVDEDAQGYGSVARRALEDQ